MFDQILAEWRGRRKLFGGGLHISALAREIVGDGPAQSRIGNVMRRIGGVGQVAARELVLALGPGLDPLQPVCDRVVDGLIVADLEMQERVVLDRAPIAAVERIGADEIDGACDPAAGAARHHQQDAVAHSFADDRKEFAGEIGPAPFARAGFHVEGEEGVPDALRQVVAGEPVDLDAGAQRFLALPPDRLAFARGKRREEIVEGRVAAILPMELLVGALQEVVPAERCATPARSER